MNLAAIVHRLWPDLRLPVRNAVIAAALVAMASLFMPNWYRSEVKLLPVKNQDQGGLQLLAATFGMGLPSLTQDPTANYEDIVKSRWVGEQLLEAQYDYHERSWRFGASRLHHDSLSAYLDAEDMDQGMRALSGILTIQKDLKSGLISLSVETKSPDLSQQVAQKTVELLNKFLTERVQTGGSIRAKYAEERLKEARADYDRAEESFKGFLEVNRNYQVSTDPEVRLKGERLGMELDLRKQVLTTLALSREQALLDAKNDTPVLNVLDAGNLPLEKSKPSRALLVIAMFLLAGALSAAYQRWDWIKSRLVEEGHA